MHIADKELLAKNIEKLSLLDTNKLEILGQNALAYYNKEFDRSMLMDKMEGIFSTIISQ